MSASTLSKRQSFAKPRGHFDRPLFWTRLETLFLYSLLKLDFTRSRFSIDVLWIVNLGGGWRYRLLFATGNYFPLPIRLLQVWKFVTLFLKITRYDFTKNVYKLIVGIDIKL